MTRLSEHQKLIEKIRLAGHLSAQVMVFQGDTYPVKAVPYTSFLHILDGFRRSEVPEPPTREAWRDSIVDERCQQPSKGYTSDHDREHGLDHLLEWAQEYARIGEPLKSAALIEAARDLHRASEVPEPSTTWVHCSPTLLARGLSCASTVRRTCACEPVNGGHDHLEVVYPQGEPSDAQVPLHVAIRAVDAALRSYDYQPSRQGAAEAALAALRAAGGVR